MSKNRYLFRFVRYVVIFSLFLLLLSTPAKTRRHRTRSSGSRLRQSDIRWSYQDIDGWGDFSEICINGRHQSPVLIATHEAIVDPVFFHDPLQFINYAGTFYGTLTNTGHTVKWTISNNISVADAPRIAGSGLGQQGYVLDQFHFHWGAEQTDSYNLGSEHVIDYRSAPMEIHFVHHNTKYASYEEAEMQPDGLAIIGFLFESEGNKYDGEYATIANLIPQISQPKANNITLFAHFPKIVPLSTLRDGIYFRYNGSMETPPCFETVTWTIFHDRIPISENSLAAFRKYLKNDLDETLENNFRPIQRLNERVIKTNCAANGYISPYQRMSSQASSSSSPLTCFVWLILLLFLFLPQ